MLDGEVHGWGLWVLGAAVLPIAIFSMLRYGTVPKRRHLRDPNGIPYVAFWNFLSEEKWTDEGVAFHRRVLKFTARSGICLIVLWLFLDALTQAQIPAQAV